MKRRTWVILGATSIIAEQFAHLAAQSGHSLLLIGRDQSQLTIIAADIALRYSVHCEAIMADLSQNISTLLKILEHHKNIDLFIAHSVIINNDKLSTDSITELLNTNVTNTVQLIHTYWHKKQTEHRILFLSSVAACKGRAKNSLYGASKAAIEIYLQGLQQAAANSQHITVARLGLIDTHINYSKHSIFNPSPPKACAKACWMALQTKKKLLYHPFFWRQMMGIICCLPFFIYKKMKTL
jgi:short-subunit dehydrogenase